jgi:hypothetical protein
MSNKQRKEYFRRTIIFFTLPLGNKRKSIKFIEFLFSFQTPSGDIRGILGNQYVPYYTAAMIELFIKAGYSHDDRVKKAFQWFDSIRQDDAMVVTGNMSDI